MLSVDQVAQGMAYLHSQNITHSDLKVYFYAKYRDLFNALIFEISMQSLNVLLDEDYNAKISDFGESSFEKQLPNRSSNASGSTSGVLSLGPLSLLASAPSMNRYSTRGEHKAGDPTGTPGWAAPEAIEGRATRASDVFGFGTMLWEVLTWRPPSLLIPIAFLRQEPLCYFPCVIVAVSKYAEHIAQLKELRFRYSPDLGSSPDDNFQMSDIEKGERNSLSVDSGVVRERKKHNSYPEKGKSSDDIAQ